MSTIDHDQATELLAAHALDALADDGERVALERHLHQCAACREQLDGYRETAARLAPEVEPRPELWDGVADRLQPHVVPIRTRRRPEQPRIWIGAAAAAVALVAGIAVGQVITDERAPSVSELAAAARDEAGATVLSLVTPDGAHVADVVVTAEGRGYLANRELPTLASDRGYQLWAFRDGQPLSVALLGDEPDVEAFRVPSRFERLVVTDEPAVGSQSPTTVPIASVTA